MATNVIMPALGVAQQTGTLLKWLKAEGQSVTKGEPLMEIETDKSTVEIEAVASGILAQVTAKPGDEVPVGQTIALILASGETSSSAMVAERPHPRIESEAGSSPFPEGEGRGEGRATTSTATTTRTISSASTGGRILASPKAKRMAKEQRIELRSLQRQWPRRQHSRRGCFACCYWKR